MRPKARSGAAPLVLVVEDEFLVRLSIVQSLAEAGYQVLDAANADDAISLLESRDDIDVVYTDVDMPGSMDGIRLAHCVAEKWPPVRLLVSSGHVRLQASDLPDGAAICIKPCPPEQMTSKIAELLSGRA